MSTIKATNLDISATAPIALQSRRRFLIGSAGVVAAASLACSDDGCNFRAGKRIDSF